MTCNNLVTIAVAGSGKTTKLVEEVSQERSLNRTLVTTFTQTNQEEIASKLKRQSALTEQPWVMGWYSFLLNEVIRPYFPMAFANTRLGGLHFVKGDGPGQYSKGAHRVLNSSGDAYNTTLSFLAAKVIAKSKGASIKRLEQAFESLYIDEVQDLCGNDLVVLEALFKSSIKIYAVGDMRQAILDTSRSDRKYKKYEGVHQINWFLEQQSIGNCSIRYSNNTYRCHSDIALLSDKIHDESLRFPPTVSIMSEQADHAGVFLIAKDNMADYAAKHSTTILRYDRSSKTVEGHESLNYGESKGLTRNHVIVVATRPIEDFLKNSVRLKEGSACGLYVAVTRAKFSLAVAVNKPEEVLAGMQKTGSIWQHVPIKRVAE